MRIKLSISRIFYLLSDYHHSPFYVLQVIGDREGYCAEELASMGKWKGHNSLLTSYLYFIYFKAMSGCLSYFTIHVLFYKVYYSWMFFDASCRLN